MIHTDSNFNVCCHWDDVPEGERLQAARSMISTGRYYTRVQGHQCSLRADQETLLAFVAQALETNIEKQVGVSALKKPGGKLARRKARREAWLQRWQPKLRAVVEYLRSQRPGERYASCGELAAYFNERPYQVSRIASIAIKAGFIAKDGRRYVLKDGRPPKLQKP
jgi:hypothetical protein